MSDDKAKALIFVREVGAIDNAAYRNLNHVDTLAASASLRQLRDWELLSVRNQSSATYYVPGPVFMESLISKEHMSNDKTPMVKGKTPMVEVNTPMAETKTPKVELKTHMNENEQLIQDLPKGLQNLINKLGKKSTQDKMEEAIFALCTWKEMSADNISYILKRKDIRELRRKYLLPLIERKLLKYKYPDMLKHPTKPT